MLALVKVCYTEAPSFVRASPHVGPNLVKNHQGRIERDPATAIPLLSESSFQRSCPSIYWHAGTNLRDWRRLSLQARAIPSRIAANRFPDPSLTSLAQTIALRLEATVSPAPLAIGS